MNLKLILQVSVFLALLIMMSCKSTKNVDSSMAKGTKSSQFEGKIIYDLTFEDRTGQISKEQTKMFMGDQQTYTIKGNKYKSEMNGMMRMTSYYLGQDTLYNKIGGMNNILWIDASSNPDELISHTIEKGVETIAGVSCDLLTITSQEGTTKYYFNKKYSVNSADYSNHEYGFWKFCMEKTGALPLKSISDTKDLYLEIVAKEIKEMKVEDSEFDVPDLPRMKSPEN